MRAYEGILRREENNVIISITSSIDMTSKVNHPQSNVIDMTSITSMTSFIDRAREKG